METGRLDYTRSKVDINTLGLGHKAKFFCHLTFLLFFCHSLLWWLANQLRRALPPPTAALTSFENVVDSPASQITLACVREITQESHPDLQHSPRYIAGRLRESPTVEMVLANLYQWTLFSSLSLPTVPQNTDFQYVESTE